MTRSTNMKAEGAHLSAAAGKRDDAPVRDAPAQPYPGRKARQGRIVLNTPLRRTLFIAGLIGAVILAFLVALASY